MTLGNAFDAPSFYSLFWNDKGIKCKINIPDTVLFRFGQLSAWWGTNKDGYVQRHTSQSTCIEAIRKQFIHFAKDDGANYSQFVAISRLGDGKPQLLRVTAFNQLAEILSDRLESGSVDSAPEIETPSMLQAFVQPFEDLRYITTYVNSGASVTCHTFQRKFSKRYTPMSAASAAQQDTRDADIISALNPEAPEPLDDYQGAVEPALKMYLRKTTSHIVNYIQRAHGLVLGALVVEHVRNLDGKVYLLSVLRTEWLSNALGHGAGTAGSHALTTPPMDIDEYDVEGVVAAARPAPPQQAFEQEVQPQAHQQQGHDSGGGRADDDEWGELGVIAESSFTASLKEGVSGAAEGGEQEVDLQPHQQQSQSHAQPQAHSSAEQQQSYPSIPPMHQQQAQPELRPPQLSVEPSGDRKVFEGSGGGSQAGTWGEDTRTAYLGSPSSQKDAAARRPREVGSAGRAQQQQQSVSSARRPHSSPSRHSKQQLSQQQLSPKGAREGSSSPRSPYSQPQQAQTPCGGTPSPSASPASHGPMPQRPMSAAHAPSGTASARSSYNAQERSPLALFPGGQQRVAQQPHPITNTWPSHEHEERLRPHSGTSVAQSHQGSSVRPQAPLSARTYQSTGYSNPTSPMTLTSSADPRRSLQPRTSTSPPPQQAYPHRAMSARNRGTSPTANPGGAPRGFCSSTRRSNYTEPSRPYSARGVGSMPLEFNPVPGGTMVPPVGVLSARGDHVNGPQRGVPLLVSGLAKEVEVLRDQLVAQNELAEANAAKVRQLEHEKDITVGSFDTRNNELMHLLACTREDLAVTRTSLEQARMRADVAEARNDELQHQIQILTGTVQDERATTLAALREYQDKEVNANTRIEQCEAEVLRLSTALKMEITAVNSLKRQLLDFSEIAENQKAQHRDSQFEVGMIEVMDRVRHVFTGQANAAGEQYAVQKILNQFHSKLRSVFLYYTQLEATFTQHWPPHLTFAQFMMFCKDSETSDIRTGRRGGGRRGEPIMLQPSDCEGIFTQYAEPDPTAMHRPTEPVLQYEAFLAAVVHAANKLRRPEMKYISEGLREYMINYLERARMVEAPGLKKGALRAALEGTKRGKKELAGNIEANRQPIVDSSGGPGSRPMSGKTDKSSILSDRPMWRNPAANNTNSNRPKSAGSPGGSTSPIRGTRLLHDVGASAVFQELSALSGQPVGADIVRAGGGFI